MNTKIKTSISIAYQISKTKKDFLCYDVCEKTNTLKNYILTNDLTRYRKQYKHFKLTEIIKTTINTINF